MYRDDAAAAGLFLLFILIVGIEALSYPIGISVKRVGPGFFPLLTLLLLGILSIIILIRSVKDWHKNLRAQWPKRYRQIVLNLALIIAYAILLPILGFLITTFLFSLVLFKFGYPDKWLFPILGALVTSILAMLVFEILLNTQFPPGIIGV
jgi:putative tricarboxylic transport membrane protein